MADLQCLALLLTIHHWLQLLESGMDVCAIFLDNRKAFDSVPHAPLMKKLQDIGLHANLLAWLHDYLTQRKQQVVVDGATSTQCMVVSCRCSPGLSAGTFAFFNLH